MKIDSIVYFSSIPWEFSFHRQQDMMAYFAGCGFPVLFVEPPVSLPRGGELRRVRGNINVLSYGGLRFERCLHSAEWLNRGLSRAAVLRAMGQLAIPSISISTPWAFLNGAASCTAPMLRYC